MLTSNSRPLKLRLAVAALALLIAAYSPTVAGGVSRNPAGDCARPAPPGDRTLTITSGGLERDYILHVPDGYDGRHRIPLVLNLHGSGTTAVQQVAASRLDETTEKYGFVHALPEGHSPTGAGFRWNVPGVTDPEPGETLPDDVQFLSDVVEELKAELCIDPRRVYGTGFSGGARMISQFACDRPGELAAITPVAGLRAGSPTLGPDGPEPDPSTCAPARAVPVQTFHGTADPFNPFGGGAPSSWQYGVSAALQRWAEINRCAGGPHTRQVTAHVSRVRYVGCRMHTTVEMYVVEDGGHTWPGVDPLFPQQGPTTKEISASELIWGFFRKHRLLGIAGSGR